MTRLRQSPTRTTGKWRRRLTAVIASIPLLAGFLVVTAAPASAAGSCPDSVNAFVTWEDWLGGARAHAYVQFQPSHSCPDGRHVKRAYVRLIRQCGPYLDSGRIYTYTASSRYDTRMYSVSAWIFDSVLWWCQTNTYYGFEYF